MKKRIALLLVVVLSLVILPVQAKDYSNFKADDNLAVSGQIGATLFAAGNSVKTTSEVDGASFIAGNMLSISSKQDYLFAAGNNVMLSKVEAKDAFVAGSFITVEDSTIRDLYAAASTITINSDITRDLFVGGETVEINGKVFGDVSAACENIILGPDAAITGKLIYPKESKLEGREDQIGEIETYKTASKKDVNVDIKISPVGMIIAKVLGTLYKYVAMLLISIILLALNKRVFERIEEADKSFGKVALTSLIGFGVLCLLPFAAIITMITVIGIPLAFVSLIVYGLAIYLSIIPTAYYFGNMMFGKSIKNKYLLLTLTLLILYVLKAIPIIGGVVGFISLIFGLGMYISLLKEKATKK